jgi:uncharacterized membrane protein YphA (DoxX/SURF4 family)
MAMEQILLVARFVLAIVFTTASLAKLADRAGTEQAVTNFGILSTFAPALARFLPLVELAIAATLIPLATAWWASLGAFILLLLSTVQLLKVKSKRNLVKYLYNLRYIQKSQIDNFTRPIYTIIR